MHELLGHHGQPDEAGRRLLPPPVLEAVVEAIRVPGAALVDPAIINKQVNQLGTPDRIDGWKAAKEVAGSVGPAYDLFWGDLGLLRVCLGIEHASAVFDGNEIDYAPLFADVPEVLKISRLVALLQDSGKVLSVARTGSNFAQSEDNVAVARKFVESISDENLSPVAKRAVVALVGLDVLGGILQGHDVDEKMAQFLQEWPQELDEYRDDLMLSTYLSDASAHSSFRLYRNARTGFVEPAVRKEDAQLSFLFARHPDGALTLTSDRCQLLLSHLPGVKRLRYLLTCEPAPYIREDVGFAEVVRRKSSAGGDDVLRLSRPSEIGEEHWSIEQHNTHGALAYHTTHLRGGRSGMAIDRRYWLPGDGRLWKRAVLVGNTALALGGDGPPPSEYRHTDPEVESMQRRVASADLYQPQDVGRPLSPAEAWGVINYIENLHTGN